MKKLTIIVFILILSLSMFKSGEAQNNGWTSTSKYKNCISSILSTNNEQIRYNNAIQYFLTEYSTTKQLQDVCYYLTNDQKKYELCVAAYPKIIDKDNFLNIYNSFSLFSYAIKLYHNTQANDEILTSENNYKLDEEKMKNAEFNLLIQKGDILLSSNKFDEAIVVYEQSMILKPGEQISYLKIKEANKRKQDLANTADEEKMKNAKFDLLIQKGNILLSSNKFDEAIAVYEQSKTLKPGDQIPFVKIQEAEKRKQDFDDANAITEMDCSTSEGEFSHIMTAIKGQTFADKQKQMAKKYIEKKCLSTEQLKRIVSIFNMDDDRLEIIKYLYHYTQFPEEMYEFRNKLTYSSTKKEFDMFIIDKQ